MIIDGEMITGTCTGNKGVTGVLAKAVSGADPGTAGAVIGPVSGVVREPAAGGTRTAGARGRGFRGLTVGSEGMSGADGEAGVRVGLRSGVSGRDVSEAASVDPGARDVRGGVSGDWGGGIGERVGVTSL